jgi:cysteinyl-tRNA synthetase
MNTQPENLQLYDTYTRALRPFTPLRPPHVGLYACGPTVYNYAHIGNLRTYISEDLLRRTLEFNGCRVRHVINVTDVGHLVSDADTGEDKMELGAQRTGKSAWEIAQLYEQAFKEDLAQLNVLPPTIWCRATEHIAEQIAFIQCIEARGYTYRTADGVYFDSSKMDDYGHLARLDVAGLQAGARVDVAEKRHPTDFALWKFSPPGQQRQMEWDSPWGVGFPGWHIECSAMSAKYLGAFFDIHCGGEDHIPVHHTNEIAQTQACHGTRLANFWFHAYFLVVEAERMSKSSGDFLRLQTLLDRGYDPLAYRYLCLNAHYRARLRFNWESLDGAARALQRLRTAVYQWGAPGQVDEDVVAQFMAQMHDDLNTPRALAVVWDLVKSERPDAVKKATLLLLDQILGLKLADWQPEAITIPAAVQALAAQRDAARDAKRWAEADALRDQIQAAGYTIADTPTGARLQPHHES